MRYSTDKPRYDRFTRSILARGSNIFVRLLRSWKKRWHPLSNPSSIFERTSISLDSWSPKFLRFHTRILLLQPQRSPDIFTRIDTHERYIRISRSKKNLPVGEIKSRFKLVRVAKLDRNCKKAPSIGIEFLIGAEKIPFYCDPLLGIRPCPVSMSSPSLSLSLQGSPFSFFPLFSSLSFSKSGIRGPLRRAFMRARCTRPSDFSFHPLHPFSFLTLKGGRKREKRVWQCVVSECNFVSANTPRVIAAYLSRFGR